MPEKVEFGCKERIIMALMLEPDPKDLIGSIFEIAMRDPSCRYRIFYAHKERETQLDSVVSSYSKANKTNGFI